LIWRTGRGGRRSRWNNYTRVLLIVIVVIVMVVIVMVVIAMVVIVMVVIVMVVIVLQIGWTMMRS